jgi:hypothetical protein
MANYLSRLRTPFFINQTSTVTSGSADLTITINSVDVYVISKNTTSDSISFEVSELIRDYLNPTWDGVFPYSSTTNDSFVVSASIKIEFYLNTKATRATNAQAGSTDTPISGQTVNHTMYGFDAYSEFLEGVNHELNYGQLLQTATIMYLPETGNAYIPKMIDTANPVPAAAVEYVTVAPSDTVKTIGGIQVNIVRICEPVYQYIKVVFVNKFGGLQMFYFNKKNILSLNVTQENYDSMLMSANTYSNTNHQKYVYNKQGSEQITLNTGYVDQGQFETIKQLMLSEQVWAEIGTTIYPVNVITNSLTKKTKVNDKLVNYSINVGFAYDVINSVR